MKRVCFVHESDKNSFPGVYRIRPPTKSLLLSLHGQDIAEGSVLFKGPGVEFFFFFL